MKYKRPHDGDTCEIQISSSRWLVRPLNGFYEALRPPYHVWVLYHKSWCCLNSVESRDSQGNVVRWNFDLWGYAGKVTEELRLGVSSSTSLEDIGLCGFPCSLDERGPCGASWLIPTELEVFWNRGSFGSELWFCVYPCWFELELQVSEALNSSELVLGPCRAEDCFNIRNCRSRYFVYIERTLIYLVIILELI